MSEKTERDPRHFARARSVLRRYRDYHDALDAAVEWEEQREPLLRQISEATAQIAEAQRRAAAVDAEAAARRAKLDAETDRSLAERRQEIERLDAVIAEKTAAVRLAEETAAAAQAECRRWVDAQSRLAPAAA